MKTKLHTLVILLALLAGIKQTAARAATALPIATNPAVTRLTAQTFTNQHGFTADSVEFQSKQAITNSDGAFTLAGMYLSGNRVGFSCVGQVWQDGGGNELEHNAILPPLRRAN
jgi:hypothetical protein